MLVTFWKLTCCIFTKFIKNLQNWRMRIFENIAKIFKEVIYNFWLLNFSKNFGILKAFFQLIFSFCLFQVSFPGKSGICQKKMPVRKWPVRKWPVRKWPVRNWTFPVRLEVQHQILLIYLLLWIEYFLPAASVGLEYYEQGSLSIEKLPLENNTRHRCGNEVCNQDQSRLKFIIHCHNLESYIVRDPKCVT